MTTTLFEVKFKDGRIFRIFCHGKNQIKRLKDKIATLEVEYCHALANGINTIKEFEQFYGL